MQGDIRSKVVFDNVTVAADSSEISAQIELGTKYPVGYFSFQVEVTGDGTCAFEYLLSCDGENFLTPNGASAIATGITKTSGADTTKPGKDIFSFDPTIAKHLKIKATETGTSDTVTVTGTLNYQ